MKDEIKYVIIPSKLDVKDLYKFLIHNCKYFDIVILALMLNSSKELIEQMKKDSDVDA